MSVRKILIKLVSIFCISQVNADQGQIDRNEIYKFAGNDKYFPHLIRQYQTPLFIWEDFSMYNTNVWGDNQSGNIKIIKSHVPRVDHITKQPTFNGALQLTAGQMIWLLDRLQFGQVEFRWTKIGRPVKGEDKYIGFGDPNEGYCTGFRIFTDNGIAKLSAFTMNHGQFFVRDIPCSDDYINARFIVSWESNKITHIIITDQKAVVASELTDASKKDGFSPIPKILMEISIQNFGGKLPIVVEMLKYDSFASK